MRQTWEYLKEHVFTPNRVRVGAAALVGFLWSLLAEWMDIDHLFEHLGLNEEMAVAAMTTAVISLWYVIADAVERALGVPTMIVKNRPATNTSWQPTTEYVSNDG